jgi:hypothetical protein
LKGRRRGERGKEVKEERGCWRMGVFFKNKPFWGFLDPWERVDTDSIRYDTVIQC